MVQKYWTSLVQLERIATIYGCHKDKLKKGTLEIQHLFMKKASSSSWRGRVKVFFFKTPGGDSLYKIIPPTQSTPWKDVSNAKAARQSLAFSQQPKRYCAASDVSPTWWLCERTFLKPMEFCFLNSNNIFDTFFRKKWRNAHGQLHFASGFTKQLADE